MTKEAKADRARVGPHRSHRAVTLLGGALAADGLHCAPQAPTAPGAPSNQHSSGRRATHLSGTLGMMPTTSSTRGKGGATVPTANHCAERSGQAPEVTGAEHQGLPPPGRAAHQGHDSAGSRSESLEKQLLKPTHT